MNYTINPGTPAVTAVVTPEKLTTVTLEVTPQELAQLTALAGLVRCGDSAGLYGLLYNASALSGAPLLNAFDTKKAPWLVLSFRPAGE